LYLIQAWRLTSGGGEVAEPEQPDG